MVFVSKLMESILQLIASKAHSKTKLNLILRMAGKLHVYPQRAELTHDVDTFSKMDPYCIVHLGNWQRQTKVNSGGGKKPFWTCELIFDRTIESMIVIKVMD